MICSQIYTGLMKEGKAPQLMSFLPSSFLYFKIQVDNFSRHFPAKEQHRDYQKNCHY